MSDWVLRLYNEQSDLSIKVDKLKAFILSENFDKLPDIDRKELREQLSYMIGYLQILNHRVSRRCNNA